MYRFTISTYAKEALSTQHNQQFKDRIYSDLQSLATAKSPASYRRLKVSNKNTFGQYYMNCGQRYSVILDIDTNQCIIHVLAVWHRAYLDKVLKGKIK